MFLRLSTSTLKNLTRCSTKTKLGLLEYEAAEASAPWELWAGDAAHVGFATFLRWHNSESALRDFEERLQTLYVSGGASGSDLEKGGSHEAYYPANLKIIMNEWFRRHQAKLPFTSANVSVESELEIKLGHITYERRPLEVRFVTRLDGMVDAEGLFILEHKTVHRLDERKKRALRLDPQIDGALLAAKQTFGVSPIGAYMNLVELGKLPSSESRCRGWGGQPSHGVPYHECAPLHMKQEWLITQRSPEQLEVWRRQVLDLSVKYLKLLTSKSTPAETLQEGRWNGSCQWCEFQEFCDRGRPQDGRMMVLLKKHEHEDKGILRSGLYNDNGERVNG